MLQKAGIDEETELILQWEINMSVASLAALSPSMLATFALTQHQQNMLKPVIVECRTR